MRRRRQRLQVSTFPFLAVLLCTMGSLILLLLVIDRRAKAAARNRALQAAVTAAPKPDAAAEARRAEREGKQQETQAQWMAQQHLLEGQIQDVQARLQTAIQAAQAGNVRRQTLQEQLHAAIADLTRSKELVQARRGGVARIGRGTESARTELARLSADLETLEKTLADLKAARQRDQQTYSLIPYKGKRGDDRKPVYVECGREGLIFHPDRTAVVDLPGGGSIRSEVEQRLTQMAATAKPGEKPYLFFLVRPAGVSTHYDALAALRGLAIDFGYEFVDADWILDFPVDDTAVVSQPWMKGEGSEPTPAAHPLNPPAMRPRGVPVLGLRPNARPGDGFAGEALPGGDDGRADSPRPGGTASTEADRAFFAGRQRNRIRLSTEKTDPGDRQPGDEAEATQDQAPWSGVPGARGNEGPSSPRDTARAGDGTQISHPFPSSPRSGDSSSGIDASGKAVAPGIAISASPAGKATAAGAGRPAIGLASPTEFPSPPMDSRLPEGASTAEGASNGFPPVVGSKETRKRGDAPASGAASSADAGSTDQEQLLFRPLGSDKPVPAVPQGAGRASASPSSTGEAAARGDRGDGTAPANGSSRADAGTASSQPPGDSGTEGGRGPGSSPFGSLTPASKTRSNAPSLPPLRLSGNRDWVITVICTADAVVVPSMGARTAARALGGKASAESAALVDGLRALIARRQSTVRPDEAPYRPQLRFLVQSDGLRTYHLAYPVLEALRLPMTRQNVDSAEPRRPGDPGRPAGQP